MGIDRVSDSVEANLHSEVKTFFYAIFAILPCHALLAWYYTTPMSPRWTISILQYYNITILQYYNIAILQYYNITILQYYNNTIIQNPHVPGGQHQGVPGSDAAAARTGQVQGPDRTSQQIPCSVFAFSKNRPSGPMLSIS